MFSSSTATRATTILLALSVNTVKAGLAKLRVPHKLSSSNPSTVNCTVNWESVFAVRSLTQNLIIFIFPQIFIFCRIILVGQDQMDTIHNSH